MIFNDVYLTDEGTAMFDRALGTGKVVEWTLAEISSVDLSSLTDEQMRGRTYTGPSSSVVAFGAVTSSLYRNALMEFSIQCEMSNDGYSGGLAKTFAIYAHADGVSGSQLVIIGRTGTGVTPSTVNPGTVGLEKFFIDVTIKITDNAVQAIALGDGNYASASALAQTNAVVEQLENYIGPKCYPSIFDASIYSRPGERFSIAPKSTSELSKIEITKIDNDWMRKFYGDEIYIIKDGLVFMWYSQFDDGITPAHIVIFSLDDFRRGSTTSLINRTDFLDYRFSPYEGGLRCDPCHINVYGENPCILYPVIGSYSPGWNAQYHYIECSYQGTGSSKKISSLSYSGVKTIAGFLTNGPTALQGYSFLRMILTRTGETVTVWANGSSQYGYLFDCTFTSLPNNGLYIVSYGRLIISSYSIGEFGKCGDFFWGWDSYYLYLQVGNGGQYDEFYKIPLESGIESLHVTTVPPHGNALLFIGEDEDVNDSQFCIYTLGYNASGNPTGKVFSYYNSYGDIPRGDSLGVRNLADPCLFSVSPFGLTEFINVADDTPYVTDVGPLAARSFINCSSVSIYGDGNGPYKLIISELPGDFSKCVNNYGALLPLV